MNPGKVVPCSDPYLSAEEAPEGARHRPRPVSRAGRELRQRGAHRQSAVPRRQGPRAVDGKRPQGKVGREFTVEQGYQHARTVGPRPARRDARRAGQPRTVKRVVKVLGMVNAVPEFHDHPKVINGCSDLFVEVFGEAGKHARSAVGMGSLPMGIPVEIECIVEVSSKIGVRARFPDLVANRSRNRALTPIFRSSSPSCGSTSAPRSTRRMSASASCLPSFFRPLTISGFQRFTSSFSVLTSRLR